MEQDAVVVAPFRVFDFRAVRQRVRTIKDLVAVVDETDPVGPLPDFIRPIEICVVARVSAQTCRNIKQTPLADGVLVVVAAESPLAYRTRRASPWREGGAYLFHEKICHFRPPSHVSVFQRGICELKTPSANVSHWGWSSGGLGKLASAADMAAIPQNPCSLVVSSTRLNAITNGERISYGALTAHA